MQIKMDSTINISYAGDMQTLLTAPQAAAELGVSLATLYSYVSRFKLRTVAGATARERLYVAADIRGHKQRTALRRDPSSVPLDALGWSVPVLESSISNVDHGRLYYRGKDAVLLATVESFERVQALLWCGDLEARLPEVGSAIDARLWQRVARATESLPPLEAFQVALPLAATSDSAAYDLQPHAIQRAGRRILALLSCVALRQREPAAQPLAQRLAAAWTPRDSKARALFDAALIVYADNGLSPSTFTARCVASAGSTPYAVVTAGVAALQGSKHSGAAERVESLVREAAERGGALHAVHNRMRRGDALPGFGHPSYPEGDPRAVLLLDLLGQAYPRSKALARARDLVEAVFDLSGGRPTVDFGVVTLCRVCGLEPTAALTLLALGRTAGWMAHALEQYDAGRPIRPLARYAGQPPEAF